MPPKKISYQAKLKKKLQENPPVLYRQGSTYQTNRTKLTESIHNKTTFNQRYFGCYVLVCMIIGAGVLIGFVVQEDTKDEKK
jgi:hypothetical protein